MGKVLSVCIPSFNMEKYLSRNLDSFIASECLNELELIVVNDGSTDKTLEIANKYHRRYPNIVKVINKPNGHYGSCVNAALGIANGNYFRIVDADDWVETKTLSLVLQTLANLSSDVVYTRYSSIYEQDGKIILNEDPAKFAWNKLLNLNDVHFDKYVHMHQITYQTQFLRDINYSQTEGVCYTDTEYVFKPLVSAKSIYCMDVSLYQYFIGRNDQSMSPNVLMKNFTHLYTVLTSILDYPCTFPTNNNFSFLYQRYVDTLFGMLVDCIFASRCRNNEWNGLLRHICNRIKIDNFDFSHYLGYSIGGCHWFKWWLKDSTISRLKLQILFYLVDKVK